MIHFQYFISMVGNRAVTFVAYLLLAYMLPPRDFGIYTLVFTNAQLLYSLASNWISHGGGRAVSTSAEDDTRALDTVAGSLMAVLAMLGLVAVVYAVQPYRPLPLAMVLLVLAYSATLIVYDVTGAMQGARQQVGAFTRLALTRNLLANGLCLVAAWFASAQGAILGQIAGTVLAVALLASSRRIWLQARPRGTSADQLRAILRFGLVGTLVTSLPALTNVALRNPVGLHLGEAQAGILALGTDLFFVPIALVINAFAATHAVALNRHSVQEDRDARAAALAQFLDRTMLVVIPYIVGGALLAAPLVDFVLPGEIGAQLAGVATPAAVYSASLATFYSLGTPMLAFRHHGTLIALVAATVAGMFAATLLLASSGLASVLWAGAAIATAASIVAYLDLGLRGHARVMSRSRLRIVLASLAMAVVILAYRTINSVEPLSCTALGMAVYALLVVRLGVIRWDELLLRKLPDAPTVRSAAGEAPAR